MKLVYFVVLLSIIVFSAVFFMNTATANANEIEEKIMLNAFIDVKVHKVDSFDIMQPDEILNFAYESGKEYNLGETLRAITYLESGMGNTGRVGDDGVARGITQIQIPTAKFILKKLMGYEYEFSDVEVAMLLTYNDKVSIILSKHYLVYLMAKFKNHEANWSHGLLSYNVGPTGVKNKGLSFDPNNYVKKAKRFIISQRGS